MKAAAAAPVVDFTVLDSEIYKAGYRQTERWTM